MDAALKYLTNAPRTVREVERRLDELEFGEVEVADVVDRLEELGLLNDESYCKDFVASRLRTKPVSRRHLHEQLRGHEAREEAIEEALAQVDAETEANNARLVAEKYLRQFEALKPEEQKDRLFKRLLARGFDYDCVRGAIEALTGEEEQ